MLPIIRRSDLVWRPWKNGGGTMADIAMSPEGAGFDQTAWRVSIAKVKRDGPFSLFPGMERGMMLIAGTQLALHIDDDPPLMVEAAGPAVTFPGDHPTRGVPIGGPIEDLNVMVRRSVMRQRMLRITNDRTCELPVNDGETTLVYVQAGELTLVSSDIPPLGLGDTMIPERTIRVAGVAELIVIQLRPV